MANTEPKTCFDRETFANYLAERLTENEESTIQTHLDDCVECQQQLEQVAADGAMWDSLKRHASLSDDESTELEIDRRRQTLIEFLAPSEDPRMLGRLGCYEICGFVGQGSTGIVLKAFEPTLNRYVAIKILSPVYSSNGAARKRFEREGRAVAAVVHQNIVPIHAVDQFRGLPYIVMQYVPGLSLLQRLEKDGPLETCEVARIGLQVAKGLAAAHKVGIVHRDVKPANVILENTIDRAMITDFGLARVADDASMTRSGTIAGTPQYMSPEQARGEGIDARSDLFSLGSLLYAACTARPPFRAETIVGVIHRVCNAQPRPIREVNPKIDQWMCDLVDRLISKEPSLRIQTAEEVASLLAQELAYLQNPTQAAEPTREWRKSDRDMQANSMSTKLTTVAPKPSAKGELVQPSTKRWIPIALVGLAAAMLLAAAFVPGAGDWLKQNESNPSSAFVLSEGDEFLDDNATIVAQENVDGADITWTKFENDWSTSAEITFDQKWQKSFDVSKKGTLTLNVDRGDVLVRPAEEDDQVTVTMMRRLKASSLGAAKKMLADRQPEMLAKKGFKLTALDGDKNQSNAIDRVVYRVSIPRRFNANVKLKSGDITVGELNGNVTTRTDFGAIVIGKTGGNLKVNGRGGCIDLTAGCEGGADVEGVNADVYAANIGESSQLRLSGGNVWIGECKGGIYAQTSGGNIKVHNALGGVAGYALDGDVEVRFDKSPQEDCQFGTTQGKLKMLIGEEVVATIQSTEQTEGFAAATLEDGAEAELFQRTLNDGGALVSAKIDSGEFEFEIVSKESIGKTDGDGLGGSGSVPSGLGGSGGLSKNTRTNFLTARKKYADQPGPGKITNITLEEESDMDGYSMYLPVSFDKNEDKYPVLVSLGGSWNVGKTLDSVNHWGLSRLVRDEHDLSTERNKLLLDSFIIVAPHIKRGQYSDHPKTIERILERVTADFRGDKDRVYLTGLSRGGHGTWGLASRMPDTFAAIVPVAGSTDDVVDYEPIAEIAVWIACNTGDGNYEENEKAMEALAEVAEESFLVVNDPDVTDTDYLDKQFVLTAPKRSHHDAWTELYTRSEVYKWMLVQSRK